MAASRDGGPAAKRYTMAQKASPLYADLLASLGLETDLNQHIYLPTCSRVLPTSGAGEAFRDLKGSKRDDVGLMVKGAFDNPHGLWRWRPATSEEAPTAACSAWRWPRTATPTVARTSMAR